MKTLISKYAKAVAAGVVTGIGGILLALGVDPVLTGAIVFALTPLAVALKANAQEPTVVGTPNDTRLPITELPDA